MRLLLLEEEADTHALGRLKGVDNIASVYPPDLRRSVTPANEVEGTF